ncbi:bifunctional metallophosphatase/5'-nucleotidase [Caldimonas brevitalea]|nr:bifunctional metallophosphatase/5'-nucleotidase [Caldimonas brevitalea]
MMWTPLALAVAALIACGGGDDDDDTPSPPAAVEVRLLAFNDFHGALEHHNLALTLPDPADATKTVRVNTGGAAYLATQLDTLRAGKPHSVTISSGDLVGASPLVSAFFRDEPTVEVMNLMKVDLNAVGNHEFDKGVTELKRIAAGGCNTDTSNPDLSSCAGPTRPYAGAKFDFLAANVIDSANKAPLFKPYVVKEFDGVKVGFVGAVTRTTPTIVSPAGVAGVQFLDEAETLNRYADELDAQGVKAIVAVIHEGGQTDSTWNDRSCANARGEAFAIAAKLSPKIDVLFNGHTHTGYNCLVNGVPVIQAYSSGRGISQVDVVLDRASRDVERSKTVALNVPVVNDTNTAEVAAKFPPVAAHAGVQGLVQTYASLAEPRANRVVGRITATIDRTASPGGDSAAGRLIADAQLAATAAADQGSAQIAFMNPGGVRADFVCAAGPCDLSFGQAFTVQPFGNSLVVMTLTGQQLKDLLEQQATGVNATFPRMLQPSRGFSYTWTPTQPNQQRVSDMRLGGAPIVATQRYRVTVNSFLADGGDGFTVLKSGTDRLGGAQDIDTLLDFFSKHSPVAPTTEARITKG